MDITALVIVVLVIWGGTAESQADAVSPIPSAENIVREQQDDPAAEMSRELDEQVPLDMGTDRNPEPSWVTRLIVDTLQTISLDAYRAPDWFVAIWAIVGGVPASLQFVMKLWRIGRVFGGGGGA